MINPNKISCESVHSYDYKIINEVLSLQYEYIGGVDDYMDTRRNLYEYSLDNGIEPTTKEFISETMDILQKNNVEYHDVALSQAIARISAHNKTINEMESLANEAGVDYSEHIIMIKAKAEIARLKGMYQEAKDIL